MSSTGDGPNLYKEAGVDVDKGDRLVEWLQTGDRKAKSTRFGSVVSGIGGFAALFRPDFRDLRDPLLITSTDGVGTKVLLGIETSLLDGLGLDLVAMCVNDLYTIGGRPLFFLDYYATGALAEDQFKAVLSGIKKGCEQSGALLLGGETAEMPGLYERGHFDLAGFVVGVVDGQAMLGPQNVQVGDRLYALPASGFHSNGYSLVRHWLKNSPAKSERHLLEQLMLPTRIYHEIPELVDKLGTKDFHALANITGGGLSGNLPRVLPEGVNAHVSLKSLPTPAWMRDFIEAHGATTQSQEGVFNLGCGMIAVVSQAASARFETEANAAGLAVTAIGDIRAGAGEASVVFES